MNHATGAAGWVGRSPTIHMIACLIELAASAIAVGATPASATEAAPDDGTIIVTARRRDEAARTVPVAITSLDRQAVESLVINTPLDLNKVVGLSGAPIGSLSSVNFAIRGQGTAFGGQPGVISYFAEVPGFPLSYFDLSSVQVIKGPQGTLFGQTSTGGVVLFEPARPVAAAGADLQVQAGDRGFWQVDGAVNIPIVADKLLARVAFRIRQRDGWSRASYSDGRKPADLNNVDNASVRASLLWRPSDRFENLTIYAQDRLRNNGTASPLYYVDPRFMNPAVRNLVPAAVPSIAAAWQFWAGYAPPPGQTFSQLLRSALDRQLAAGPLATFTNYSQRNTTKNYGVINQTNFELTDHIRIRNIFGLRWQTQQGATYDQDATDLPLLDFQCRFVPGTTSAIGACAETGGWPDRTLTDEVQLQGDLFDNKLQWQVGAFYLQSGVRRFRESTRPFVVFGTLSGDPASAAFCASVSVASPCTAMARNRTTSHALFGEATYELLPDVRLTAGYRETWDYTRTDTTARTSSQVPFAGQFVTIPVYGGTPAPGATIISTTVKLPPNGSYNLSLDWRVGGNSLLYVAHRSGYKSGGINVVANPGTPQRTYGPERAKDIELGLKTDWSLGSVRGNIAAAAYHTWYSDIQGGDIIPGTAQTVTTNLANARINGVEIDATIVPFDWLTLTGNLAYTDAHYTGWIENSTCAAQYWRPQCAGLASSAPIVIDHSGGNLAIAGQTIAFTPDRFPNTSKWQWSFRPAVSLKTWVGEDVTLLANIYHRGPYVDATAVANSSKLAGVPPLAQATIFGGTTADPYDAPGYTLTDLRLDWRNVKGSRVSLALSVTNVANKIYRVSSASAFEIIGDVYTIIGEPRMIFGQISYNF